MITNFAPPTDAVTSYAGAACTDGGSVGAGAEVYILYIIILADIFAVLCSCHVSSMHNNYQESEARFVVFTRLRERGNPHNCHAYTAVGCNISN